MGDNGTGSIAAASLTDGTNAASPRQLWLQPQLLQFPGAMSDDRIGVACRTIDRQQSFELIGQIVDIDAQTRQEALH